MAKGQVTVCWKDASGNIICQSGFASTSMKRTASAPAAGHDDRTKIADLVRAAIKTKVPQEYPRWVRVVYEVEEAPTARRRGAAATRAKKKTAGTRTGTKRPAAKRPRAAARKRVRRRAKR